MSARRAPSTPPELPGYDFRQVLGSGGFADVFLYQQALPSRLVAVKVLLPGLVDRDLIEDFRREANVMAELSTHPSIVNVYGAAAAPDGRPYLVMEYCPRPNLGVRYRKERLSVPEVLQLGVQIAGAVETAHRAGILHRDIKPANILVTAYNRPALTDFGIATTGGEQTGGQGMSIPWSAPEAFDDVPTSTRESDVFALGATLYTLLAGRTPFEVPGMGNTSLDLIERIRTGQIVPLARTDVSPALANVLRSAMEVEPSRRFPSALAFGRALQQVEADMSLSVTPMDVLDDALPTEAVQEDDDGATRIRGIVSIDPEAAQPAPARHPSAPQPPVADDATVLRAPGVASTPAAPVAQQPANAWEQAAWDAQAQQQPTAPRSRRGRVVGIVAGAVVAVALAIVLVLALLPRETEDQAVPDESLPPAAQEQAPQQPIRLIGEVQGGEAVFSWTNPVPEEGDVFFVRVDATGQAPGPLRTEEPTIAIPVDPDGQTCVSVAVVRSSGTQSLFTEGCIDG